MRISLSFRVAAVLSLAAIIFSSCATISPLETGRQRLVPARSPETLSPQWLPFARDTTKGLDYLAGKTARPRLEFHALRIDLWDTDLQIRASGGGLDENDEAGFFRSIKVSSFVRNKGLLAGLNTLPFSPVSGKEGEPRTNVGLVIADGIMLSPPHTVFDALVFYTDGGAVIMPQSQIKSTEGIANAVGGFHRILEGGSISERTASRKARHPRSAAGISPDGRYLYLLVIDGRRPGSVGSTEAETAALLKQLGAQEGINFDGGGSSALALRYPDGQVRVVNTPIQSGIPGRERAVAGCLGVGLK
jgi:hypothetical protein